MDFESFLKSEALRPLAAVYSRALLDTPETAAVIARLPPPKAALLYHAALMRAPARHAASQRTQTAEELCAPIVAAYGLVDADTMVHSGSGSKHLRTKPTKAQTATAQSDGNADSASVHAEFSVLSPPPLCCFDALEQAGHLQHLERAMAQREAALQASIVERMTEMCAGASRHFLLSSPHA